MRAGLVDKFKDNGLDPSQIVLNGGAGQNFGGRAQHGAMQTWLVPAVHSTLLAYPSASVRGILHRLCLTLVSRC